MRIYLPGVSIKTTCIDKTAADVTCNTRNITEIYCLDGIYESDGNKIKRIKIDDVPSEKTTFKGIDITVFCQNELKFSFNRVIRLLMWVGVFERYFLSQN